MCSNANVRIADAALKAAEAQWDLICTINAEASAHGGVVVAARKLLVEREDGFALQIFDQVTERVPDLERARALVEG